MEKPQKQDYLGLNASYIERVPQGDVLELLLAQNERCKQRFETLSPEKEHYRYASDKWTVKEVLGHMTDVERTFAFRAFAIARGERSSLPGMDEVQYAKHAQHAQVRLEAILAEFYHLRASHYYMLIAMSDEVLRTVGNANGFRVSVLALIYAMYGHVEHHLELLDSRYGL